MISWLLPLFTGFFLTDDPQFNAGKQSLDSFIKNTVIYPEYAKQNCLEGTVQVSINLNTNGYIYKAYVSTATGLDLDDEALRVVRRTSGKWLVPAGFDTTTVITIPIIFSSPKPEILEL